MQRSRQVMFGFFILPLLCLSGCATQRAYQPPPAHLEADVQMPGFPNVRAWGDTPSRLMEQSALEAIKQEKRYNHGKLRTQFDVLALSGGGSDGAFGAGVLCGWTKSGKRPQFRFVTGISTGALIAPFAFLGSDYDDRLQAAYTTMSDKDVYKKHSSIAILLSLIGVTPLPSLTDNAPLADLIARWVDADMLKKIAAEQRKGRRLVMGTTQLNAQRLVAWDMGAIATRGTPEALALFRKIMLASASLPATFPPQYFDVIADGKKYTEMHVDGGVEAQVMLYENAFVPFARKGAILKGQKRIRNVYIIRNLKTTPEWQLVKPELRDIAIRAIDTLTKSQGIGDLYRLYTYANRDESYYHLAYIPEDFTAESRSDFDTEYMKKLFAVGYEKGRSDHLWQDVPPLYSKKQSV